MVVVLEVLGELGVIVLSGELAGVFHEDTDVGRFTNVGFDEDKERVRVLKGGVGNVRSDGVVDEREAERDLEFEVRDGARWMGVLAFDVENGAKEPGVVTGSLIDFCVGVDRADVVVHARAGVELETRVREFVDVVMGEGDDMTVVVEEREQAVLGFVEFRRTDGETRRECGDLGGHLAISVVNRVIRLVKEPTLKLRWIVAGDTVLVRDRERFTVALDILQGKDDCAMVVDTRTRVLVRQLVATEDVRTRHDDGKNRGVWG